MYNIEVVKTTFGVLLLLTSLLDAAKYSLQAWRIERAKSAKIQSRKFVLMAIGNDLVKTTYSILIMDIYIFLSSILALICMFHLWYICWVWYPYKYRGLTYFKRPSMLKFTINAMIPNHIREKL